MSVRNGDRDEGKLQVIEEAERMYKYTYEKCVGKTFPKSERFMLPSHIEEEAYRAESKLIRANRIRVTCKLEAEMRILLEEEAIGHLDELCHLIDAANLTGRISDREADHWTDLVSTTQDLALK